MLPIDALRGAFAGRYDLQRECGSGSIGTVYQAIDCRTGHLAALKVLHRDVVTSLDPARFTRAVNFAAGIQHPSMVPCHDPIAVDGILAYAMPLLSGESLRDRLMREQRLSMSEALRIITDIASALDSAHAEGLVHGRLYPGAIHMDGQRAMLADIGVTAVLNADPQLVRQRATRATAAYLSPEQCDGRAPGPASDVYGLGCLLFEMLAGAAPYTGATVEAIFAQHQSGQVPGIRILRPTVPPAVETVLRSAMAPNPRHRPISGQAFIALLQGSATAEEEAPARPSSFTQPPVAQPPVAAPPLSAPPASPPPVSRPYREPEPTPVSPPMISPKTGRPTTWALTIDAKDKPWYRKPMLILLAIVAIVAFSLYQLDKVIDPEPTAAQTTR